jgi:hypothetical protein
LGLINKMRSLTGAVPRELLEHGLLGRGIIVSIQQTGVSTGADFDPAHVCVFTVEVALDNEPRYTATCRQAVRATVLPQLMSPGVTVAVRVDPADHARVALSLGEEPPIVTFAGGGPNTGSASRVLEYGVSCKAVITESLPMGMRTARGEDMYAFGLTVLAAGRPPYQVQVGNPVPAAALPLVYAGNTVPAKRMVDGDDREIVIDWAAALAEAEASIA